MNVVEEQARRALHEVIDPELGINIVDLGLVYEIAGDERHLRVSMTATNPACPLGPYLTETSEAAIRRALPRLETLEVSLIWEPPWTPERMSPTAREQLGW